MSDNEWIPVEKGMPEEHDSIFAKFYGTEKWCSVMWRSQSYNVLVTVEYKDGTRSTDKTRTHDGKWQFDIKDIERNVIAWMPMPEPYNK